MPPLNFAGANGEGAEVDPSDPNLDAEEALEFLVDQFFPKKRPGPAIDERRGAPGELPGADRALEQARNVVGELNGIVGELNGKMGMLTIEASLCPAATRGDIEAMKRLLAAEIPVDKPDASERTPLMVAAAAGQMGAVDFLLSQNANTMVEVESESPLTLAIRNQHVSVVRMLLQRSIYDESLSRQLRNLFDTPASQGAAISVLSRLLTEEGGRGALINILGEHLEGAEVLVNMYASLGDSLGRAGEDHDLVSRAAARVNADLAMLLRATAEPSMLHVLLHRAAVGGVVDQVKLLLDDYDSTVV